MDPAHRDFGRTVDSSAPGRKSVRLILGLQVYDINSHRLKWREGSLHSIFMVADIVNLETRSAPDFFGRTATAVRPKEIGAPNSWVSRFTISTVRFEMERKVPFLSILAADIGPERISAHRFRAHCDSSAPEGNRCA